MSFWRTYYHLIWATESRQSLITCDRESELYGYIIGKADAMSCIIHAIGGVEDHIHLVASIPPKLSIAEFVKTIKGSSAYHLHIWDAPNGMYLAEDSESHVQVHNDYLVTVNSLPFIGK